MPTPDRTLGVSGVPPWLEDLPGWQHLLGFWGAVALAVAAAAILTALAQPRVRAPRRLRRLAWAGAALMTPAGLLGTGQAVAGVDAEPALDPAVYAFLSSSLALIGVACAATAWLTRRRR